MCYLESGLIEVILKIVDVEVKGGWLSLSSRKEWCLWLIRVLLQRQIQGDSLLDYQLVNVIINSVRLVIEIAKFCIATMKNKPKK